MMCLHSNQGFQPKSSDSIKIIFGFLSITNILDENNLKGNNES